MIYEEKKALPLCKQVAEALETYLTNLEGHKISNLYNLVLEEVEAPLFRAIMKHTTNNQSEAAKMLGISRGTLRKKLQQYKLD